MEEEEEKEEEEDGGGGEGGRGGGGRTHARSLLREWRRSSSMLYQKSEIRIERDLTSAVASTALLQRKAEFRSS